MYVCACTVHARELRAVEDVPSVGGGASDEEPVSELRSRRRRRLTSHHATARAAASSSVAAPAAMPATTGVGSGIGAATGASNSNLGAAHDRSIDHPAQSEQESIYLLYIHQRSEVIDEPRNEHGPL
jgi:hypothetical protein